MLAGHAQCWAPCGAPQDRRRGCPAAIPAKGHKGLEYLTQEEMLRELGLAWPGAEKAHGDLSRVCECLIETGMKREPSCLGAGHGERGTNDNIRNFISTKTNKQTWGL